MKKNEQGYLLIIAIVLIVIVGFIVGVIIHTFITTTATSSDYLMSKQSFYLAESGLEFGLRELKIVLNSPGGLSNLTTYCNGAWKPEHDFGNGQFRFKCNQYNPSPLATLTANISATNKFIPLSTVSGYASLGRVSIDSESIHYTAISTDSTICGQEICGAAACPAPCLVAKTRGADGTTAIPHSLGQTVIQTQPQVVLTSEGVVSNFQHISGSKTIETAVQFPQIGFQNFWAVGFNGRIMRWNQTDWENVVCSTCPNKLNGYNFYGVSCANPNDCWAVGQGGQRFVHWDGTAWTPTSQTIPNTLRDITCIDSNDCWAVGNFGLIMHWNGSSWNTVSSPTTKTLNSIACTDTNNCWAVGEERRIIHWDGSNWSIHLFPSGVDLHGIDCVNANLCWAVGDFGTILRWNGSSWWFEFWYPYPHFIDLLDISCADSTHCWASSESNRFARYQSGFWTWVVTTLPNKKYYGIACENPNLCFTVGEELGSKVLIGQWDGGDWDRVGALKPDDDLRAVTVDARGGASSIEVLPFVWSPVIN
ncbi:MAG: hypothetical protein JW855_04270 [Gammaproteobacteria bacterium]|nr:hypothetical protein [Gammaproteobacteria bacterium]